MHNKLKKFPIGKKVVLRSPGGDNVDVLIFVIDDDGGLKAVAMPANIVGKVIEHINDSVRIEFTTHNVQACFHIDYYGNNPYLNPIGINYNKFWTINSLSA